MRAALAGVVFDLDGTLVDTETVSDRIMADALDALGHTLTDDELHHLHGKAWSYVGPWMEDRFGVTVEQVREQSRQGWDKAFEIGVDTYDDTIGVLSGLVDQGLPVAVCTSSDRGHLGRVLASIPALADAFDVSVSSDDVANHKPDPEPYQLAVSLLGVPAERTAAVEDSATGVASAVGAGLRVIGRHSGPSRDLSAAHLEVDVLTRGDLDRVLG